eukprot:9946932-Heterocapsa_arctica.AAC.1
MAFGDWWAWRPHGGHGLHQTARDGLQTTYVSAATFALPGGSSANKERHDLRTEQRYPRIHDQRLNFYVDGQ